MLISKITQDNSNPRVAIFYLKDLPANLTEVQLYFKRSGMQDEYLSTDGWVPKKTLWGVKLSNLASSEGGGTEDTEGDETSSLGAYLSHTIKGSQYRFFINQYITTNFDVQAHTLGLIDDNDYEHDCLFFWDESRDGEQVSESEMLVCEIQPEWGLFMGNKADDNVAPRGTGNPQAASLQEAPEPLFQETQAPEFADLAESIPTLSSKAVFQDPSDFTLSEALEPEPLLVEEQETVTEETADEVDEIDDDIAISLQSPEPEPDPEPDQSKSGLKWFLIVLLLAVLAYFIFAFTLSEKSPGDLGAMDKSTESQIAVEGESLNVKPPSLPTDSNTLLSLADDKIYLKRGKLVLADVLKNDKGDQLEIIAIDKSEINERSISVDTSDGRQKIKYLWDSNRQGEESLTYTVKDKQGNTAKAVVTFIRQ